MEPPQLKLVEAPSALSERSDDELMVLTRGGRTEAFAVLVERHMRALAGFACKMTGDPRLGDEIAQEVWLQIWAARLRYRSHDKFTVYLYTCARNRCRNQLRNAVRRARWDVAVPAPTLLDAPSDTADQLERLLERERQTRVLHAIVELPEALREPLLLRIAQGLDYDDIAAVLSTSEASVRSRVHRGIAQLRSRLEKTS